MRKLGVAAAMILMLVGSALADLDGSYVVPVDHPAIQYESVPVDDPAARLSKRIQKGEAKMEYNPVYGYLPAMLHLLNVPLSSQVLVFSKTSFQAARISPRTPRALYFNDSVSVGWVKGGDVLEIAAVDPRQGVIFYTLDQEKTAQPRIQRRGECLQCHASGGTLGVPGLVVRSVYPEPSGMPLFHAGSFITDHRSPLKQRWGGWYVTGTHGLQSHMGNVFVENPDKPDQLDTTKGTNITDLSRHFDTGGYLAPHSDIVALMVLEHQTRMTNLITRTGYETRMALHDQRAINQALGEPPDRLSESSQRRIRSATETLLKYLLFADEARLSEPVKGTSNFAAEFAQQGSRDKAGRSLRELDLQRRLLRYPCSWLIHSEAFKGLPEVAKTEIYRRLWEVLSGEDQSKAFEHLTAADRRAILEILRDTEPDLAEEWTSRSEPFPGVAKMR